MPVRTVEVTLQGKTPLLMHRFPLEPVEAIDKKPKEEQAEIAAYRDEETGNLYVPGVNVQRAFIGGAVYSKGKGRASLQKPAAACLMVSPANLDLGIKDYAVDSRPVVIPSTKGRVIRHRPRINDWKISFELDYDDTLLSHDQVREIVDNTCQRVGFLDFRPERKGPFGRAMVIDWHLRDLEKTG